jgi:D-beta-D-heptose 7-phosphate kinase/D-beta-D-heptose 1-phosphate adenosyltransferase
VGLNSDMSVSRLKGQNRPVNSELDRKFVLEALKYVDEVVIFEEDTPLRLIKELKPSVIVKGGDYSKTNVVGSKIAEVVIFSTVAGYSTTNTLRRVSSSITKDNEGK